MRPGDFAGAVVRPVLSGTMKARQTKKARQTVTKKQWLAYITVAAVTTLVTKKLDDLIERRLGDETMA